MNPKMSKNYLLILTIRISIILLSISTIFLPWTEGGEFSLALFISSKPPIYCSGYNYIIGCEPIGNYSLHVQMLYLVLIPIILILALLFLLSRRNIMVILSSIISIISLGPAIIWFYDITNDIPYYMGPSEFTIAAGFYSFIILVIFQFVLGIITIKYCDMDT